MLEIFGEAQAPTIQGHSSHGSDLEIGRKPESELDERMMVIMEIRHANAVIALQIERLLSEEAEVEYGNDEQERLALHALRERVTSLLEELNFGDSKSGARKLLGFKEGVERYFKERNHAKTVEDKLKERMGKAGENCSPPVLGRGILSLRTGSRPYTITKVKAVRRGAYFIISFSKNGLGYVPFNDPTGENYELSHAVYRNNIELLDENLRFLVIKDPNSPIYADLVLHEKWHFVVELLLDFFYQIESLNNQSDDYPALSKALSSIGSKFRLVDRGLKAVKEEFLSYIKDGSTLEGLSNLINDRLYTGLKKPFSEAQLIEVRALMGRSEEMLGGVLKLFNTLEERSILAFLLLDVPLIRLPERLRAIEVFYSKRSDLLLGLGQIGAA